MIFDPNKSGYCFSYYATWNIRSKKPKYGVHYLMLDEYIKRSVNKEKTLFNNEFSKKMSDFLSYIKTQIEQNSKDIDNLSKLILDVKSFMYKIIEENELKTVKFEETKKPVKKKKKVEDDFNIDELDEDDFFNG